MGGIGRVERITYNSGRVERIKRVSRHPLTEEEKAEISAYLAKFPNPNHLSFAELLEQAQNNGENIKLWFWRNWIMDTEIKEYLEKLIEKQTEK